MKKLIPNAYQKDILNINYEKLKEKKVKILIFDFDNTIMEYKNTNLKKEIEELLKKLKKDFEIYVVSNSIKTKKLEPICEKLDITFVNKSMKPLKKGYKKLEIDNIKPSQIAAIGDQLLTDVYGANKMGYYSILTDPLKKENEVISTKFNRMIENIIMKKTKKLIRGEYYE